MLAKSLSVLAIFAFAAQASAEVAARMPYQPKVHKMSVRDLFGISRRQGTGGYEPSQSVCGAGNTCAEACGAGYAECTSSDDTIHCYDPSSSQTCCPDNTGNSCDSGYYCTQDHAQKTWCCPDNMDLTQCAAVYTVTGGLVSETSTIASSTSTSVAMTTPSANSTITAAPVSTMAPKNGTTTELETASLTASCASTGIASAGFPGSNTTSITFVVTGTPHPSKLTTGASASASASLVSTSQGNAVAGPFAALAIVAGAFLALL